MTILIDLTAPDGFDQLKAFVEEQVTVYNRAAAIARMRAAAERRNDGPHDLDAGGECTIDDCDLGRCTITRTGDLT